jgi:hypothetical protein
VQCGDVLLFTTKTLMSRLLRIATRSEHDHVAIIVRVCT